MGGIQHGAARRFVHAAGLHADQPVFHDVGAADAMLTGDLVQLLEQLDGTKRHGIETDGIAFFKSDRHDDGLVRRCERILGHHEDVLGRLLRRVLEDAAFMRAVPEVAVGGVRLLGRCVHRDALRVHVRDEIFAALEFPFAPGRDHLQVRRERRVRQLEADLIVAFTGTAMRERVGADPLGYGDLVCRGERPCHRRAEEIGARVDGAGAQRGEDKIADELLAQVLHDAVVGAGALGFLNQAFQLSGALPHVGGEANHMRAVGLAQPGDDRGGIEPA